MRKKNSFIKRLRDHSSTFKSEICFCFSDLTEVQVVNRQMWKKVFRLN